MKIINLKKDVWLRFCLRFFSVEIYLIQYTWIGFKNEVKTQ